jgi:hypothetical protein
VCTMHHASNLSNARMQPKAAKGHCSAPGAALR